MQTFQRDDVYFDTGLSSIENSGIVFPMLRQLGIDIEFKKYIVSIGIEDQVIKVIDKHSIDDYEAFLKFHFPENAGDISAIIKEIIKIMGYMDVLYGIDNPALKDFARNRKYLFRELLPWLFRFLFTMRKINKLYEPVEDYLKRLTDSRALIDIMAQHFFRNTPISFALSYFSLYLDYHYPKGVTATVVDRLTSFIAEKGAAINTGVSVTNLNPEKKYITDSNGNRTVYSTLIWACDLKQLYNIMPIEEIKSKELACGIENKRVKLKPLKGGDSVFTVYLTVNENKDYFERICTGHFFYTPEKRGLSTASTKDIEGFLKYHEIQSDNLELKSTLKNYLLEYFKMNTFEIAIPVLRDPELAPAGKVGLEVSLFLDYELDNKIDEYGWAFTNPVIPAVNQMLKVNDSVKTILPSVFQAGGIMTFIML